MTYNPRSLEAVPFLQFDKLIQKLRENPEQNWTKVAMVNTLLRFKSKVEGTITIDSWPDFSAILSHQRSKTESLQCCVLERKEEHVQMVIQEIAKKKCDYVLIVDEWLGKDVQAALQSNDMAKGPIINTLIAFYLPKSSDFTVEPMTCPEGYVLRSLEECHIEEVSVEWSYMDRDKKISLFTQIVKQQHSVGIFPTCSGKIDKSPVGWCLQYPSGFFGHLFVNEEHRRKGLAKVLVQHICCLIEEDGEVPLAFVERDNIKSLSLFRSLSFVQSDFQAAILTRFC
ncbi:uncharacterized protein LOC135346600 [Halichondria panicea]|uniref:uncharacterized protein LOC135346600 n=1 Tax=Halichondria panicea TaxID=6063 RepID=UPI00312B856D